MHARTTRPGRASGGGQTSPTAVDDSAFRALESASLRRAVLGLELRFHHDLLVARAEGLRIGSPLAWAIEASVLRSVATVLEAELGAKEARGRSGSAREHTLLADEALLDGLDDLGPIGVLTQHLCRATCHAVDAVRAEGTDDLGPAFRCALGSLSSCVWPCASAVDDRAWWVLEPQLGDFNDDLRAHGADALRQHLAEQIDPKDQHRLTI